MSLNQYKTNMCELDWIAVSSLMKDLSSSLRKKDKYTIEKCLIYLVHLNFSIADKYDIDMNIAWNKWNYKANSKVYY